jgi:FlaA1/EpsC-like NDP-sugar epimerase
VKGINLNSVFRASVKEAFEHENPAPRWIIYSIDLLLSAIAVYFATLLRFNFSVDPAYKEFIPLTIIYIVFVRASMFLIATTFASLVRMTSQRDMENNIMVVFYGTMIMFTVNSLSYIIYGTVFIPTSILILEFIVLSVMINAYRLAVRAIYTETVNPSNEKVNIIIYGSDQHAFITKRAIDSDSSLKMKTVAFIDNGNNNAGCQIDGVEIYNLYDIEKILKGSNIEALIVPSVSTSYHIKEYITDICLDNDVRAMHIPDVRFWINGQLTYDPIDNLNVEDLLEREPITLDMQQIRNQMAGRTVLVTGAAGSIGSEIVRQLVRFKPRKIVLFDQDESALYTLELSLKEDCRFFCFETAMGNISDEYRVEKLFKTYKPEIVFHAAAYKHVPMMECNPYEAVRVNISGTKNLVDNAVRYGVKKFVMISTDKAVRPTNVMGASKRIAEMYVQASNQVGKTIFITTRFGNVLGSNGSVIPIFQKQLKEKGELTVTHPDITRFFMSIPEACQLVLEAGAMGKTGEIFIFDMGKPVRINDLAKKMILLYGKVPGRDVKIRYTGLRPGEKLYEELLNDRELTLPTHNPRIMIARTNSCRFEDICLQVDNLLLFMDPSMKLEMVAAMKEIVPDYQSKNSEFEQLDEFLLITKNDRNKAWVIHPS